jgi:hypothetical protein
LANTFAVRADAAARELHQTPDYVQAETGTEVAAAATRMQARKFLEQPRPIDRPESNTCIADRQLNLAIGAARR